VVAMAVACFLPAQRQEAPAARKLPRAMVRLEHYQALKEVFLPGDVLYAFVIRQPDPSDPNSRLPEGAPAAQPRPGEPSRPPTLPVPRQFPRTIFDPQRLDRALAGLNAIQDARLQKSLIVSSVSDLKANSKRFPKDVTWVAYNSEPGMTPPEELENIEQSVREFATVAHAAGLRAAWGPTNVMIASDEQKYLGLARYVDSMGLQHQKVLQFEGVEAFVELTKRRSETIRKINPAVQVAVQVVVGRGSNEQCIQALKGALPYVDEISVWTMKDFDSEAQIIAGARGQKK